MRAFRLSLSSSIQAFKSSMRAFVEHDVPMIVAQSAATDRMMVMRSERSIVPSISPVRVFCKPPPRDPAADDL